MTVLASHSTMRRWFAASVAGTVTVSFVAATRQINRGGVGSFVADGYLAGMMLDVLGSAANDGRYTIEVVAADDLTVVETVAAEAPIACSLYAVNRDPDGLEEWPLARVRLVGSGFGDTGTTITGWPATYAGASFTLTCNAGAPDTMPGVALFDWYVSQRNDDPATQYLTVAQAPNVGLNTYSGSITVVHNANATAAFGALTTPTPQQVLDLFKYVHVYVRQVSDGAIQWENALARLLANYGA